MHRYLSHPTVAGVQQKFLNPSHQELNISPDAMLGRNLFVLPDGYWYALVIVLKRINKNNFPPNW